MATTFIYNETPIWTVDWVNKVFTTGFDIDTLEEFYIWWIPYRNIISIGTNVITLNEAPPTGAIVSVDYFKA